jgi:hypothetical protein
LDLASPISFAAADTMATPAPSSCAPWPRSHESRWAPSTTTSRGRSRPGISPITFAERALSAQDELLDILRRTCWPEANWSSRRSASGLEMASAGISLSPGSLRIPPVCASRFRSVPTERMMTPMAPRRAASAAPRPRTVTARP